MAEGLEPILVWGLTGLSHKATDSQLNTQFWYAR